MKKFFQIHFIQKARMHDEAEKCVFCGSDTKYTVKVPVNERLYYIEGAGQLCSKCWKQLYF